MKQRTQRRALGLPPQAHTRSARGQAMRFLRGALLSSAALLAGTALLASGNAYAAAPTTSLVEGVLTSAGGGAAADGTYNITFSIWATSTGGTAAWTEGPVAVTVKSGRFNHILGGKSPIGIAKIAALKSQWLGVKIGSDPMLPRQKLQATLFSRYAGSAGSAASLSCTGCVKASHMANNSIPTAKIGFAYAASATKGGPASDLKCTGCVSVSEMKFDGNVNLGGNNFKAKNATFSGDISASTVTAASFVGDGSKLTGIKTPSGECKVKGEVVKGINANGTLKCVKALDPSALPADGLNEISNNMITNQFVYTVGAPQKKLLIPDGNGKTADSIINFPNIGTAQTLDVKVTLENSDLSQVSMTLLPPDDKKTGYILCDPCGKANVRKLVKTYNAKNPPQKQAGSGKKIGAWVDSNPVGSWTLKVLDSKFCVVQLSANKLLCPLGKNVDGWISDWSISMQYISNKKIAVNGDQEISGDLRIKGNLTIQDAFRFGDTTASCTTARKGSFKWTAGKGLLVCDGAFWVAAKAKPVIYKGYCSTTGSTSWRYYCLDKTLLNTASEYLTVNTTRVGSSTSNQTGRITIKIPGYYRLSQHRYGAAYYCGVQIYRNGAVVSTGLDYHQGSGTAPCTTDVDSVQWMSKGNYFNVQNYSVNGTNWHAGPSNSYVTVEYLGTKW